MSALRFLISYAYMGEDRLKAVQAIRAAPWLLDSGAFTALWTGRTINLDAYCEFLADYRHLFERYITLDVIGDTAGTRRNFNTMLSRGLCPMGVLTLNENARESMYYAHPSQSICVAGGNTMRDELYGPRIARVRKEVGPDVWIHGLGFTRGMSVAGTRVNAVDSSTWNAGGQYGSFLYDGGPRGPVQFSKVRLLKLPFRDLPPPVQRGLAALELTKKDLDEKFDTSMTSVLSIQSTLETLRYASRLYQAGVAHYFAVVGVPDILLGTAMAIEGNRVAYRRAVECIEEVRKADPSRLSEITELAVERAGTLR